MRRALDGLLNAGVAVLVLIFLTGGFIYRGPRVTLDVAKMGPAVAAFLVLVAARRLVDRRRPVGELACVRLLRSAGDRLARSPGAVYVLVAFGTALLIAVAVRRHEAFQTAGFDLGIFDQALWNTARGRLLFSSIKGETILFADHFDPLQLVLVPFYLVAPSPLIPLVAQGLLLGLGAVPLYWLARERFPGSVLSVVFPLLYLLYLPLRNVNRFDYHPTAFVPALALLALYFMERARWTWMVAALVLVGLCKETMPAAGVGVGLYLVATGRQRALGAALAAGFGFWFYAGFAWIIPAFNPEGYPYFSRYQAHGGVVGSLLLGRKLLYLWQLLAPLAFLPALAPVRLLSGLPFLAQNLLSTSENQISIDYHYAAELVPFLFFAAVGGAETLLRWWGAAGDEARWQRGLAAFLLAASLLFHDRPETFYLRRYRPTPHLDELAATLRAIPPEAPVSAQNRIVPRLAHRLFVYVFPDLGPGSRIRAEYVILDRTLDRWPVAAAFEDEVAALPGKGYETLLDRDGILLFRRRAP